MLIILASSLSVAFAKDPFLPPWAEEAESKNKKEKRVEVKHHPTAQPKSENRVSNLGVEERLPSYEDKEEEVEVIQPSLEIDGIVWSDAGKGVFISGRRIYKVGDKIGDGCVVKRINPNKVIVRCGNNLWSYTVEGVEGHEIY